MRCEVAQQEGHTVPHFLRRQERPGLGRALRPRQGRVATSDSRCHGQGWPRSNRLVPAGYLSLKGRGVIVYSPYLKTNHYYKHINEIPKFIVKRGLEIKDERIRQLSMVVSRERQRRSLRKWGWYVSLNLFGLVCVFLLVVVGVSKALSLKERVWSENPYQKVSS